MEPLEFREIAELINFTRSAEIEVKPRLVSAGNWELYAGVYRVHTQRVPFEVLYLRSKASAESLRQAKREVTPNLTQVVYSPSLDQRQSVHKDLFGKNPAGYWTARSYLA